MKIFLDTANVESIQKYIDLGIVDGITTNPTLLFKENNDPIEAMKKIVKLVDGPVSLEVVATGFDEMMEESLKLAKYGDNVVVKVPMTSEGLKTVHALTKKNIKTNVTLIFSANQALLASKAGATYVSPFIGRSLSMGFIEYISTTLHEIPYSFFNISLATIEEDTIVPQEIKLKSFPSTSMLPLPI